MNVSGSSTINPAGEPKVVSLEISGLRRNKLTSSSSHSRASVCKAR
jgi:hypothetical protein